MVDGLSNETVGIGIVKYFCLKIKHFKNIPMLITTFNDVSLIFWIFAMTAIGASRNFLGRVKAQ